VTAAGPAGPPRTATADGACRSASIARREQNPRLARAHAPPHAGRSSAHAGTTPRAPVPRRTPRTATPRAGALRPGR